MLPKSVLATPRTPNTNQPGREDLASFVARYTNRANDVPRLAPVDREVPELSSEPMLVPSPGLVTPFSNEPAQSALDTGLSQPEKAEPLGIEEMPVKKARKGGIKKKKKADLIEPETAVEGTATGRKKVLYGEFDIDEQEVLSLSRITLEVWLSQVNAFPDMHELAGEARRCISESIASLERSVPSSKFAHISRITYTFTPHIEVVTVYWRHSVVALGSKYKNGRAIIH